MKNKKLNYEIAREFWDFDPDTGLMLWKFRDRKWFESERSFKISNSKLKGKLAFNSNHKQGYKFGTVFEKPYLAHRVIWLWMTGSLPTLQIDHINHDRKDNRWLNLRLVTNKDNQKNSSLQKNSTSLVTGVSFREETKKWRAYIFDDYKQISLGSFDDIELAIKARKKAEKDYGYHENHGNK